MSQTSSLLACEVELIECSHAGVRARMGGDEGEERGLGRRRLCERAGEDRAVDATCLRVNRRCVLLSLVHKLCTAVSGRRRRETTIDRPFRDSPSGSLLSKPHSPAQRTATPYDFHMNPMVANESSSKLADTNTTTRPSLSNERPLFASSTLVVPSPFFSCVPCSYSATWT